MDEFPRAFAISVRSSMTYGSETRPLLVDLGLKFDRAEMQMIRWDKQKETLMATYTAVVRPALEYASSIWSPLASSTSINKLQVMQNAAMITATGCIQNTNIQHLHDETLILPIHKHLQLHVSQYKQKILHPSHPSHKHTTYFNTPRLKNIIFNNGHYITNIPTDPHTITTTDIKNKYEPCIYCL